MSQNTTSYRDRERDYDRDSSLERNNKERDLDVLEHEDFKDRERGNGDIVRGDNNDNWPANWDSKHFSAPQHEDSRHERAPSVSAALPALSLSLSRA